MIPLIGFAPDLPPTTEGVFVDCTNITPTIKGFRASAAMQSLGFPALSGECRGAAATIRLDNQRRLIAGTPDALYEAVSKTWLDRSRAGGYSGGAENRWRFAQFGNVTLAANSADPIQASTGTDFADIPDAPAARIITTVAGFVMAFATTSEGSGSNPDMWWCSGLYDHTAWTPDVATQCANGRLFDTPGEIRAGKALGNNVVAYKQKSMFLGQYVGPPVIWSWTQIPGEIGALNQECVIDIDTAHVFIGADDFWIYDGSRPVPIGAPVREWFFDNANPTYLHLIQGCYDRSNALATWYFASNQSQGALDLCIHYNAKTQRWGKSTRAIQAPVEYMASSVTYDDLGDVYATYDDIGDIAYDSPQWFAGGREAAVFDTNGKLMALTGSLASNITTWDVGDDAQYSTLKRVRPRLIASPTTGNLRSYSKAVQGDALVTGPTATYQDGKFDLLVSARWHRVQLRFTGPVELSGIDFDLVMDGTR